MNRTQIYALIDMELSQKYNIAVEEIAKFIEKNAIPIAQYRNKNIDIKSAKKDIKKIKEIYKGALIINDYIELADLADGIHIGQEDLYSISHNPTKAIEEIRDKIGDKILGLSTHNTTEIDLANTLNIDYIGLGAWRSTATKKDAKAQGESLLEIAKLSKHPVALIGGIEWDEEFPPHITYKVLGSALYRKIKSLAQ